MATPPNAASVSAARYAKHPNPGAHSAAQSARKSLAMRKYNIASLLSDGQVRISDQIGPAMPIFESAFSAFAHGTLINTNQGPVAIEDLVPGMKIATTDQGNQPLLWIGSMTLMPRNDNYPDNGSLTRIMADGFGMGRPSTDLMAGPGARLLLRPTGLAARFGSDRPLTPATQMADGMNAIEIQPQRPVTVYHLCLRRHAIITANGMDTESFHPGAGFERNMGPNMLTLFMSFFPHVKQPKDFGPLAHTRLPLGAFDTATDLA